MKCYLAGYMSGKKLKETTEWRIKLRTYYTSKGWGEIIWYDPFNGKELESIDAEGLGSSVPPNSIIHRDYQSVINSDLVVVNMDTFGCERPLIGTLCEIAWAWEHHIPIVMITDNPNFINHPFMSYFASWIVKDVDELIEKKIIPYFYKGQVTARY